MNSPVQHNGGIVLPDRGDGLHWLRCDDCGKEWAERDSGAFAKGSKNCGQPPGYSVVYGDSDLDRRESS